MKHLKLFRDYIIYLLKFIFVFFAFIFIANKKQHIESSKPEMHFQALPNHIQRDIRKIIECGGKEAPSIYNVQSMYYQKKHENEKKKKIVKDVVKQRFAKD